jgi:hypothetical protein
VPGAVPGGVAREFVGLASPLAPRAGAGGHPCQGVYHRPTGARPHTAFVATHYNVDFSEHYLAGYLARRGYGFLGWNTRFRGNEAYFLLDHALAEIGVGVRWLRDVAGVERVVLLGNSGGGSLMAAYQSQAVEPNVTPSGRRAAEAIAELPAADLYVSLAAHPGRLFHTPRTWADLRMIDPAIEPSERPRCRRSWCARWPTRGSTRATPAPSSPLTDRQSTCPRVADFVRVSRGIRQVLNRTSLDILLAVYRGSDLEVAR